MTWRYEQGTGLLYLDAKAIGQGYSGFGDGKNNHDKEDVQNVGPIPCGSYRIGPPFFSDSHGPFVMALSPQPGTQTFGRSGFLMHGDSIQHPGEASHGCIIMTREVRMRVWDSGDRDLEVFFSPGEVA